MRAPDAGRRSPLAPRWHWRNCRSIGFRLDVWLWPWAMGVHVDEDVYGGTRVVQFGPFLFSVSYSIGNISSEGLDRFTGLSEVEAYERAVRFEGVRTEDRP